MIKVQEEQRQKAEEEARRAEELSAKKAAEERAAAAKLEKFDSFDVIGCLVDRENQELSRTKRETERLLTGPEAAELGAECAADTEIRGPDALTTPEPEEPKSTQEAANQNVEAESDSRACYLWKDL